MPARRPRRLGFRRCVALATAWVGRVELACGRAPSFGMALCQAPEVPGVGGARFAAMVASVARGATTERDHEHHGD